MEKDLLITVTAKYRLVIIFFALIGVILVFLPTKRFGAGISPDSVGYIGTARNLIKGMGFLSYDGNPLVTQPPLYPIVLAFAGFISGKDPLIVANIVNALILGLIVYSGGLLAFKYFSSFPVFALVVVLAIVASIPLFIVSVMAWSEPLFILFVVLSLLFAITYLKDKTIKSLVFLSLSVALATLTRYIGIALICWGAFIIIFFYRGNIKTRIAHVFIFFIVSILPIGIWLFRNYAISSSLFGPRASSTYTLSQNLLFVFNDLMKWYIPGILADHRPTLLLIGAGIGFFVGLSAKNSSAEVKVRFLQASPIALFVIIYTLFLVILSTISALDQIGDRLLSPIYVPLTLLFLYLVQTAFEPYRNCFSRKIMNSFPIMIFGIVLLLYPSHNITINAETISSFGQGYGSKAWIESQTVKYLLQHKALNSECIIYSNSPEAAYILANFETKIAPEKTFYNSLEVKNDISDLRNNWPVKDNKTCLVWFDTINRSYLFTVDELQSVAHLNMLARLADGAIYSVTPK